MIPSYIASTGLFGQMSLREFSGAVLSLYWYLPGWDLGGNMVTATRRI